MTSKTKSVGFSWDHDLYCWVVRDSPLGKAVEIVQTFREGP